MFVFERDKQNQLIPANPEDRLYVQIKNLLHAKRYQPETTTLIAQLAKDEADARREQRKTTDRIAQEVLNLIGVTDVSLVAIESFL